ncbi:23S rRNA m(2)A-2503 methyltransferase [Acidothermus cellulolyticus 11B]|uniref:Probable dual-specificity RNA methyltransferase RlmN n=2 Tax=Acidothermus cellulolyticus TaxID=28049 RepID=RLMN_ACIC1|nr:RecName: Full=Probable dual-specificity RNA methyltransferase RlmN; AltName: Full=23S rRNA (adenine(2503)-C(2))-methyltransferase; AltName: Full=23S rRNA m2A2503 methyltransferase; AltName: Full=Ribosomal RNA large subunit methyltransferase N; AltName: Full=tRNA (adenine(37)-C(2))-methyltransferase; AltName: Full=tRNA m2A37 methyltransferase [Acidothermus cellulolyticus 11B]ABK53308.1 23S rRNA m(2)A-2503 methyltransferase [Acidothermus cellulolyticus 11B]
MPAGRAVSGRLENDMTTHAMTDAARAGAVTRRGVPRHLADFSLAERRRWVAELGEPSFRAVQISAHYFGRLTENPDEMTDLPASSRRELVGVLLPPLLRPVRELACDNGLTRKILWRLSDGAYVESVLMRYPPRHSRHAALGAEADADGGSRHGRVTLCVSSQAGCGMGCPFCATGQAGLVRNLSAAEIVAQVAVAARTVARGEMAGGPGRLSNVVFMGMGEPLANYRSVVDAVRRITEPPPEGLGISQRSVTVSTVGLVPAIERLATEGLAVTLAVSLHAPDDELRNVLVPINRRWPVRDVLGAAARYAEVTKRRVSVEYALIRDVNDQPWRADALAAQVKEFLGRLGHVNLIPLNPTPGSPWTASTPRAQAEFVRRLAAAGVTVTVRDTRGREVNGACGQLAATVEFRGRTVQETPAPSMAALDDAVR